MSLHTTVGEAENMSYESLKKPIPRPHERAMGVYCDDFGENGTALYDKIYMKL